MRKIDETERFLIRTTSEEFINFCFQKELLTQCMVCPTCKKQMKMEKKVGFIEDYCWRCYTSECLNRYKRHSILIDSFFEKISKNIRTCMRVICRMAGKQPPFPF